MGVNLSLLNTAVTEKGHEAGFQSVHTTLIFSPYALLANMFVKPMTEDGHERLHVIRDWHVVLKYFHNGHMLPNKLSNLFGNLCPVRKHLYVWRESRYA